MVHEQKRDEKVHLYKMACNIAWFKKYKVALCYPVPLPDVCLMISPTNLLEISHLGALQSRAVNGLRSETKDQSTKYEGPDWFCICKTRPRRDQIS